jgi:ADP-ribosylglycohydrolase
MACWQLRGCCGYFGLFDLGLGRATAQRIASLRDGSASERAEAFWTALILNIGLGVGGGLLIWPIATYFFGSVFKIEEALRPEMQSAVPWLVLAVPWRPYLAC